GEPGAERAGQPGDRLPRGRSADLPGEPSAGEARRDDVRAGGDRGQAVLDIAERGAGARGEPQPGHLGAVQDVYVHVQVDRRAAPATASATARWSTVTRPGTAPSGRAGLMVATVPTGTGKSGMCSSRCQGATIRSQAPLALSGISCVPLFPLDEQVPEPWHST